VCLGAYVGNDPINSGDPSGQNCIDNGSRTQCDHPNPAVPNVSYPSNDGEPNKISPEASGLGYHEYSYSFRVGSAEEIADAERFAVSNPTPGNDDAAATREGTLNNAQPYVGNDPVRSYVAPLTQNGADTGRVAIVNVTEPGHQFHDGYIVQWMTTDKNGNLYLNVAGEGNSVWQNLAGSAAGFNEQIWSRQARQMKEYLLGH
jgi:hypothetical protein